MTNIFVANLSTEVLVKKIEKVDKLAVTEEVLQVCTAYLSTPSMTRTVELFFRIFFLQ